MDSTSLAHPAHLVPDRTTRHHRVEHEVLELLNEYFGIDLLGVYIPGGNFPTPQKCQEALERFPTAIWGSIEEATQAWEDQGFYHAILEANKIV